MIDIFVISLKDSIKRRQSITEQFNSINVPFTFFDAISPTSHEFNKLDKSVPAITKKRFGYKLLDTEIACFASHKLAWETCIKLNKPILIMEDNVKLHRNFHAIYKQLPLTNCNEFILKFCSLRASKFKKIKTIFTKFEIVEYKKRPCGAQAYLITPSSAKKLMDNSKYFIEAVDDYMEKEYKHGVKILSLKPNLVDRDTVPSVIGNQRKNKSEIKLKNKIYIELFRIYENAINFYLKLKKIDL